MRAFYPPPDPEDRAHRTKRILWRIFLAITLAGAGVMVYPTLTDILSQFQQRRLEQDFASQSGNDVLPGEALTRIRIDSIGVNALVAEGTDRDDLRAGAGHYANTPLPCDAGNVAIAGHRTTFGGPFRRLDELRPGQTIKLSMPGKHCSYRVVMAEPERPRPNLRGAAWITDPNDTSVLIQSPGSTLTLTTCHPKGSAEQRLIIRAELIPA